MHVLVCLADAEGDVVSRDELSEAVWAPTIVGEESLTRAISELRQVFEDDAQAPVYIETVRGRGYRLLPRVRYVSASKGAAAAGPEKVFRRGTGYTALRWGGVAVAFLLITGAVVWQVARSGSEEPTSFSAYQARPLTSFPGLEVDPALSPDGQRVAFAWGESEHDLDLYVKVLGEETLIRLTETPHLERKPAWAPDGRSLAFIRADTGCEVVVVPARGGPQQTLAACSPRTMPTLSWSPDGETLVWAERPTREAPLHLIAFDVNARVKTSLTAPPLFFTGDDHPAFSPDGQALAFVRTQAFGIQDVYLYERTSKTTTRLTTDKTKIGGLTWTPEGEGLLLASKRNGFFSLWYLPRAGGPIEWANAVFENVHHPSMAQQGTRRVYERRTVDTNIWRLPLSREADQAAPAPQPWLRSTRWEGYPAVSPDGSQIAFASDRSGSPEIWLAQQDGSHLRKLTSFEGPFVAHPQWAADGKTIVFEARAEDNADLYLLHLETGVQERLTTHPAKDVAPRWSRDGRSLYFGSNRQAGWQLWKKSLLDGALQQVTTEGGYIGMEATGGQELYYVKHDVSGLWKQSVAGGPPSLLLEALTPSYGNSWIVTEQGVYFIQQVEGAVAQLSYYDLHTQVLTPLLASPNPLVASGLALSTTHDALYYVQVDRNESDLIIEEPFTH